MTASGIFSDKLLARFICCFLLIAALAFLSACAGMRAAPDKPGDTGLPAPGTEDTPGGSGNTGDYRIAASSSLTAEGYHLLRKNDYDRAIRVLEQAVGINPGDGQGYFYLAEAWIEKKNFNLAARFNELAILYLREHPAWSQRALNQKKRIERIINK